MKLSLKMIALELNRGHVRFAAQRTDRPDQMRLTALAL